MFGDFQITKFETANDCYSNAIKALESDGVHLMNSNIKDQMEPKHPDSPVCESGPKLQSSSHSLFATVPIWRWNL